MREDNVCYCDHRFTDHDHKTHRCEIGYCMCRYYEENFVGGGDGRARRCLRVLREAGGR